MSVEKKTAFDLYWDAVLAKNPNLATSERMTISVDSFKRQMRQAFDAGFQNATAGLSFMDKLFGRPK